MLLDFSRLRWLRVDARIVGVSLVGLGFLECLIWDLKLFRSYFNMEFIELDGVLGDTDY